MTTTRVPVFADGVEERLDRLDEQLGEVVAELRHQRLERERWRELADELAPIAEQAMNMTIAQLASGSFDAGEIAGLVRAVLQDAAAIQAWIGPLRSLAAMADEAGPLATSAVSSLNARLQLLDERGYFAFARQVAGVLDTIVTSFSHEDVKLLGDNIVLILETVKEMTQPEVMGLLGRTALSIRQVQASGATPVPSTFALLGQMRDPDVRRGLARLLATLRTLGAQPVSGPASPESPNP